MIRCFHLSPGDNDCIVSGEVNVGKIFVSGALYHPETNKKYNKVVLPADYPFGICQNCESKYDSMYNRKGEKLPRSMNAVDPEMIFEVDTENEFWKKIPWEEGYEHYGNQH